LKTWRKSIDLLIPITPVSHNLSHDLIEYALRATKHVYEVCNLEPTTPPEDFLNSPTALEKWNSMTVEQKQVAAKTWDVYRRDGLGFVLLACGKLVISCKHEILDAMPGIYHGGTWVIHAYVAREVFEKVKHSAKVVDGFDVIWIPYPCSR
jgi:hypothetical protein